MSSGRPEKGTENKKPSKQKVAAELNKLAELLYDEFVAQQQQTVPEKTKS